MGFSGDVARLMVFLVSPLKPVMQLIKIMAVINIDYAGSTTGGIISFAGGATTFTIDVLGLKAGTPVFAQLNNATNSTTIANIDVTTDQIVIKFDANPGACDVAYLIFNALT